MIDLREKGLQNSIIVNEVPFSIKTDFRVWIKFYSVLEEKGQALTINDVAFVFVDRMPLFGFIDELLGFFINKNATPKSKADSGVDKVIDYVLDGEYIVGSFMQVYGIDLTTCDMHWHLFKALLTSLPSECKMSEIISMRSYKPDKRKEEVVRNELKDIWSLPKTTSEDEEQILQELNELFYNS